MKKGLLLILFLPALAFAFGNSDFDCADEIEKLDKCGASTNFMDMYKQICKSGNEIEPAHLLAYDKAMEMEIAENECLAKIYVRPRYQADFEDS